MLLEEPAMHVRHLARLAMLVFLAGPTLPLECLLSCAPQEAAASDDCHRRATDVPTVSIGGGCGGGPESPAPFVRAGDDSSLVFAAAEPLTSVAADAPRMTTTTVLVSDPGPPDRFAARPLRI